MSKDTLDFQEIWDLLKKVGLMKTVTYIGSCYEKLVHEFILNLSSKCNREWSREFYKVYVRGCCVKFSPKFINPYLGRRKSAEFDSVPSLDKVAREVTINQIQ